MKLMKRLVLDLTPAEKFKIEELKGELEKICKEHSDRCENCPFDKNNNGKCIQRQFFNILNEYYID